MSMKRQQKGSLKQKILLTYAALTIIALGSIATAAGIFIGVVGNTAASQTSAQLTAQVQYSMQNKTHQTAQFIQDQLQDAVNDLQSMSTYVKNLWTINRSELGYRKSYYHMDYVPTVLTRDDGTTTPTIVNGTVLAHPESFPQDRPSDAVYNSTYGKNVSFTYSHYLVFPSALQVMGNDTKNMNATYKDTVDRSAFLDIPFSQLIKAKPQYRWIYMEFKIGLDRCMPWHGTEDFIFPHYSDDGVNTYPRGLDLRTQDYYTMAVTAQGQVHWTSPYLDPSGQGFMITISQAVYNGSVSPAHLIGVMCMDLTIKTITQSVGNIHMYKTGYGFLIDDTGSVVSHPLYTAGVSLQDLENQSISNDTFNSMMNQHSGFVEITKLGNEWYLSYEPVPIAHYSMGIMVPKAEALAPVQALQQQANLNLGIQLAIMLSILGVILVVSLWIGITIANSVVQPIQRITNMALKLSTEDIKTTIKEFDADFDREMKDDVQKDDEIGNLAKAFKNLVKAVQDENDKGPGKNTKN
ncbi:MAG TPA: cache domain-containing protein [Candidatus Lokiarchaeia archaeon]|nr:cache domain-containing protein [Candidatus Lokiarchaeia archaeon]